MYNRISIVIFVVKRRKSKPHEAWMLTARRRFLGGVSALVGFWKIHGVLTFLCRKLEDYMKTGVPWRIEMLIGVVGTTSTL